MVEMQLQIIIVSLSDGREEIMNPMVQNMVQGYEAAKYEYVWISSSRVKGEDILTQFLHYNTHFTYVF
jgi:hypothetical protein